MINKYKYIELLCIRSEVGPFQNAEVAVKEILNCLNELEKHCPSKEDYNQFCLLLTLQNLDQHPDYKNWNPSNSRIHCFNKVCVHLEPFLPAVRRPGQQMQKTARNDRLVQMIIKGILYESCVEYCQRRATAQPAADSLELDHFNLLDGVGFTHADLSLLSWLQSIPAETFNFQFEDKTLNVQIDKLEKPSLMATWSEMILVSPIKPRVFPHSATPFTRVRAADLMSKSLTSGGLLDGSGGYLNKSVMSFSLKDAANLSQSSMAGTTEFHLNGMQESIEKNTNERIVDRMFEEGDVFNSSLFGKLQTIKEGVDLAGKIASVGSPPGQNSSAGRANNSDHNSDHKPTKDLQPEVVNSSLKQTRLESRDLDRKGLQPISTTIQIQVDSPKINYWQQFQKKRDESQEHQQQQQLHSLPPDLSLSNNVANKHTFTPTIVQGADNGAGNNVQYCTPESQLGQKNFVDMNKLMTSTPKGMSSKEPLLGSDVSHINHQLNFSNASSINANRTLTMTNTTPRGVSSIASLAGDAADNRGGDGKFGQHFSLRSASNQPNCLIHSNQTIVMTSRHSDASPPPVQQQPLLRPAFSSSSISSLAIRTAVAMNLQSNHAVSKPILVVCLLNRLAANNQFSIAYLIREKHLLGGHSTLLLSIELE